MKNQTLNGPLQLSIRASGLAVGLILHLVPNIICATREDSCESLSKLLLVIKAKSS